MLYVRVPIFDLLILRACFLLLLETWSRRPLLHVDISWSLRDRAVSVDCAWSIFALPDSFANDLAIVLKLCRRYCPSLMNTAPKIARLDMATSLTECPEFSALQSHYEAASKFHMRDLFQRDPQRFDKFRYEGLQYLPRVLFRFFVMLRLALICDFIHKFELLGSKNLP